mgnify:CR=1 FL=1
MLLFDFVIIFFTENSNSANVTNSFGFPMLIFKNNIQFTVFFHLQAICCRLPFLICRLLQCLYLQ